MFRARYKADFKRLRILHRKFTRAGNYSAALLCLDPTFASTLPLQGTPTVDPGPELSLHSAYFELLDRLRREDRLDAGSIRQKVFAFQPRQDDRFFVPANSFLYTIFQSSPNAAQEMGGCIVTHEELRHVLNRKISDYIYLRAKQQHNAYRRRLGTAPCLAMVARGECPKADCQFQHLRPEKITVDWFNARIRLVLTEIQILNLAGFHPLGVILCVSALAGTLPDSDLGWIGTGSVSFTLLCTLRHQSSDLLQHSILGTHLNRWKGSEFCGNGFGRRVTNSYSARQPHASSTSKRLSPSLCPFVRWHTTLTSSERWCMSLARGCAVTRSGHIASLDLDWERSVTSLSGTSFCS